MVINSMKYRDISLVSVNKEDILVIACDSCGGIGSKERDVVKVDPKIMGYYTTQVALMEVIAVGARPIAVINPLSVEMNNTGKKILQGIKKAVNRVKTKGDIAINGSTEENIPVVQTAMGLTVIGVMKKRDFNHSRTRLGDIAVVIGEPKVGEEVIEQGESGVFNLDMLQALLKKDYVNEILPVGSKGILYEIKEMARINCLNYKLYKNMPLDIEKTAGPSTCAIVSLKEHDVAKLLDDFDIPITPIAFFN
ncbi:AIR synthase related protein [Proteinivorax tanatarense]|uniref:AIR synthase related protein n=1 Tax=Proteinivorax tanatarense TaxID=1260629 RepID=A0AAU7VIV7_9FIRM